MMKAIRVKAIKVRDDDLNEFEDDHQYYVGTVSANDGNSIIIDGSSLKGESPWLRILNPGMLLEIYGKWEDDIFVAEDIKILMPAQFAYYEGPAEVFGKGQGSIKAWTNTQKQLESVQSSTRTDNSITLIAYYDGASLSATPDLFLVPEGLQVGWVELSGVLENNQIIWLDARAFP